MTNPTYQATVYIAGDLDKIRSVCREFCFNTDPCVCVTITATEFIYSGASETGAAVGLINYPRFPSSPEAIWNAACILARDLLDSCCQRSCTVVATDKTEFIQNPRYRHKT